MGVSVRLVALVVSVGELWLWRGRARLLSGRGWWIYVDVTPSVSLMGVSRRALVKGRAVVESELNANIVSLDHENASKDVSR
jgi:hypothetical protein